jgi:hypothetical protein
MLGVCVKTKPDIDRLSVHLREAALSHMAMLVNWLAARDERLSGEARPLCGFKLHGVGSTGVQPC